MERRLTKQELIEQLRFLANDDTPYSRSMGAMCYSPKICVKTRQISCKECGKTEDVYEGFGVTSNDKAMKEFITKLKKLGYEVKMEFLCGECAIKYVRDAKELDNHRIYLVFWFKAKNQPDYHIGVVESEYDYYAVEAFLEGRPTFMGDYDETHLVKDETERIRRMLGVTLNES